MSNSKTGSEVVGAFFAALGGGEVETAFALLADDVRWTYHGPRAAIPFAGTFEGKAGVQSFFATFGEVAEPIEMAPSGMAEADGTVYVRGVEKSRAKATGRDYAVEWMHAVTVVDGMIATFDEYLDTATVAAAFA